MFTPNHSSHPWSVLLAVLISTQPEFSTAAETVPTAPKDHSLFVGQEVSVLVDGEYCPVVGAGRHSFVVEANHRTREVPTNRAKAVRVTRGLKLSTLSASIDQLSAITSSDRMAQEQMQSLQSAMRVMGEAQDRQDYAQGHAVLEQQRASYVNVLGNPQAKFNAVDNATANSMEKLMQALTQTQQLIQQTELQTQSTLGRPVNSGEGVEIVPQIEENHVRLSVSGLVASESTRVGKSASPSPAGVNHRRSASESSPDPAAPAPPAPSRVIIDRGEGQSDRLDLELRLSAPQIIDDAYLIVSTEYTIPASTEVFRRVLAQRIGHLDSKPRKISLSETDFPSGFHIRSYALDLYAGGQEVATNLSPNRTQLSRDEAYSYVAADYLVSHKGESHPPAAVLMVPRAEFRAAVQGTDLTSPIFVRVANDGHVLSVSADESGTRQVTSTQQSALRHFRFVPALDKGTPVEGRAKLVVADFVQ